MFFWRRPLLRRLEGKGGGDVAYYVVAVLLAGSLAIAAGSAGVLTEYVILRATGAGGVEDPALFMATGVLVGSLLLSLVLWIVQTKVVDLGVIIELHLNEFGDMSPRSSEWSRVSMAAFVGIHRYFFPHRDESGPGVVDISAQVASAVDALESSMTSYHKSAALIAPDGPFPALFGMGALAHIPPESQLFEVLDLSVNRDKGDKTDSGQGGADVHLIDIAGKDIVDTTKHLKELVNGLPSKVATLSCIVVGADGGANNVPGDGVETVYLALGAVKNESIEEWIPFKGVNRAPGKSACIVAGTLADGANGGEKVPEGPEVVSGGLRGRLCAKRPIFEERKYFEAASIENTTKRHSGSTAPTDSAAKPVSAAETALYLAAVVRSVMARYPRAEIHVTARVPRVVAMAMGTALVRSEAARSEESSPPYRPEDIPRRVHLWGTLVAPEGSGAAFELAEFAVFPRSR